MTAARPLPVLIDTDLGVDDALALLLAWRSPELHVVGVTTTYGNVPVEQATRNLFQVLKLAAPAPAPLIGQGAARPMKEPLQTATEVHGPDGLGGLASFRNEDGSPRYPTIEVTPGLPSALKVWEAGLRRYPEGLVLITLGPLTNLAEALETIPQAIRKLRSVITMGGAITVPGNVTPAAEFNVFSDPHAAQRVMEAGLPLTLVPLDVTIRVTLSRETIHRLTANRPDPVRQFLRDATGAVLAYAERTLGHAVVELHDPLAVGVASDSTLVERKALHVNVETRDRATKGRTVEDGVGQVQVALKVDAPRFLTLFQNRLCRG